MPDIGLNEPVFTVSEINGEARDMLEGRFSNVWIEGEVSNFTQARSGHWYFSLKDEKSVLRCAAFASVNRSYRNLGIRDGSKILVRARLSIYSAQGSYQAQIQQIELAGEGALRAAYEALRSLLENEGLFDQERKQPLPNYPNRIALISSPFGDAPRDVCAVVRRRYPITKIILVPTAVQGGEAENQIIRAFDYAERMKPSPDVIIVTRGGGSLEDLWAFNLESVARRISNCSIPVISAIGHQTDFTIADFVSDKRAATPTAAGEIATPDGSTLYSTLHILESQLTKNISRVIQDGSFAIEALRLRLKDPYRELNRKVIRVNELEDRLKRAVDIICNTCRTRLVHAQRVLCNLSPNVDTQITRIGELRISLTRSIQTKLNRAGFSLEQSERALSKQNPADFIASLTARVDSQLARIHKETYRTIELANNTLRNTARSLHTVSPLATLDRGYAIIAQPDKSNWGKPINSIEQVEINDYVVAHISDGLIKATVTGTSKRD